MELLPEADSVVRQFMPCLMEAAGLRQEASDLKRLEPIECLPSLKRACLLLNRIGKESHGTGWDEVITDAVFWGEAALWAALKGDLQNFIHHVERMRRILETGFIGTQVH